MDFTHLPTKRNKTCVHFLSRSLKTPEQRTETAVQKISKKAGRSPCFFAYFIIL